MKRVVHTKCGYVDGIRTKTYYKWLGIPFAKPPVGELRFRRAVPAEPWDGVKRCDSFGPKPIQMAGGAFGDLMKSDTPESEDCLYLNVWAPREDALASSENVFAPQKEPAKHPVFVWFYGGGQHGGEASAPEYDLKSFAKNGIVGVSFNYRLGALGFYDFTEFSKNTETTGKKSQETYSEMFDSNCGVSDMILALKWVHENIAAFGGDPEQVTIAGESAGGTAVLAMMASPKARPLFKRAIVMSGIPSNITRSSSVESTFRIGAQESADAGPDSNLDSFTNTQKINNRKFLRRMGIKPENIGILKTIPVSKIAAGCMPLFGMADTETPGIMAPGPVIDDLIPETPLEAIQSGKLVDKEIIFGTCRDEGNLFSFMDICPKRWDEIEKMLQLNGYEDKIDAFYEVYCQEMTDEKLRREEKSIVKTINRDRMFWADTMKCAIGQSRHGRCYLYQFDYVTPASKLTHLGATHTMDVGPALNTYKGSMNRLYKGTPEKQAEAIHRDMHEAFVSFIKTGEPGNAADWPCFTEENWERMTFAGKSEVKTGREREDVLKLWKDIRIYS